MRLLIQIAWRYLIGKKSTNAINIIMGIALFGIAIGSAALVLILAVFNGFEKLIFDMYDAFNPDLRVVSSGEKFFNMTQEELDNITGIEGVMALSKVIEEIAYFEYGDAQEIAYVKGVDRNFHKVVDIDSILFEGTYESHKDPKAALLGNDLRNRLSVSTRHSLTPLKAYMIQTKKTFGSGKDYKTLHLNPTGSYRIGSESDRKYVITSYELVQNLLNLKGQNSSIEIALNVNADVTAVVNKLKSILPPELDVQERLQQNSELMRIIKIEKLVVFLIAGFTMILIIINLIGTLWMLVLDRKKDLSILHALGLEEYHIGRLYMFLGIIITSIGVTIGFILALAAIAAQKHYGLLGMPDTFAVQAYPILPMVWDFVLVAIVVLTIGTLGSWLPARKARKSSFSLKSQ